MNDLDRLKCPAVSSTTVRAATVKMRLDDVTQVQGFGFGATGRVRGEVVFNSAMGGHVEILTDVSYCGQILVLTSPPELR